MNACILSREDLGWLLFRYITIRVGLYPSALLSDSCLPSPVFHACETRQQSGDHRRNNDNDILRSIILIICLAKRMLVCQFSIYKIIWLWWSNYNRFFFLPFTKEVFKITRKSTHRCLSLTWLCWCREVVKKGLFTVRLTVRVAPPFPPRPPLRSAFDFRLWLHVFWNRFFTRKKNTFYPTTRILNCSFLLAVALSK